MRTITLVIVPGSGMQQVQVGEETTLAQLAADHGLNGRNLIVDGSQVAADQWSSTFVGDASEIFATGAVKGN